MKTILIGADLTANSENAFTRAVQLTILTGARLHVLHVDRRLQVPGGESESSAHHSALDERLREFVRSRAGTNEIDYDIHLETRGRTYDLIAQHARRTGADLIVVGRSKRLGDVPGSVLLTTGQVVAGSDCPVLVVTQPVSGNYRQIALESELSRSSERKVLSVICGFGPDVQLSVLRSTIDNAASDGLLARVQARLRKRRQVKFAARAASQLRVHGLPDERLSVSETEGEPFDSLLSAFDDGRFDVVVLTAMRHKLSSPETRERLTKTVPAASCDALIFSE